MTTISLRDYLQHIDSNINAGNIDEAIFHCTNILKTYPKCAEAYRLLGKSLLEKGRTSEAKDVFAKLLSVFPDDFTAHAGLSEIYDKEQQVDKAIWHLERAFESQPSNVQIQAELRNLFTSRNGVPPAKIRLTRGALIRMYAKGELYQQAIAEAQSVLEGDGERQDVRLLLAKMYQASGSPIEAAETCSSILENSPYCYEANRIMREIEFSRGEAAETSVYSSRMAEVDPYSGLIDESRPSPLGFEAEGILLDKPDFDADEVEEDVPEWARQMGIEWSGTSHPPSEGGIDANNEIDNDKDAFIETDEASEEVTPLIDLTDEAATAQEASREDELPDWISKAGWIRASEEETPPATEEVSPAESFQEDIELAAPAEELPDWLKNLSPEPLSAESPASDDSLSGLSDSDLSKISALSTEDIDRILGEEPEPDLIKEPELSGIDEILPPLPISDEPMIESAAYAAETEIPDLPDWLRDLETSDAIPTGELETPSEWVSTEANSDLEVPKLTENAPISADAVAAPDFVDIKQVSTDALELTDEVTTPVESTLDELIKELDHPSSEAPELPAEVLPPQIVSEEKTAKTEVPAWVQKILGSTEVIAPAVTEVNKIKEPEMSEDLEPLLTELPGETPAEGAISEDVNLELMTWLEDINPDDALEKQSIQDNAEQALLPASEVESSTMVEAPDISLDKLTDSTLASEIEIENSLMPDAEQIPVLEEAAANEIHDRLSSLLDSDTLPTAEEVTKVEPLPPPTATVIPVDEIPVPLEEVSDTLDAEIVKLLDENRFKELTEIIAEKPASSGLLKQLSDKALSLTGVEPESFDLWKTIGDIGLKKSEMKQALEAYKKAEKILYH